MKTKSMLALALVLALFACQSTVMAEPVVKTGTATAPGFEETVTVTVTTTDGVITEVAAKTDRAEATVGAEAIDKLPAAMVAANTVDVDVIAGATGTSKAVIAAARNAMVSIGAEGIDLHAWALENGYVLADDYHIVTGVDAISGSSYKTEVAAQKEHNLMTQEEAKELTQDYLHGFVLYYKLAEGSTLPAERIYVQSNIDLFESLNAEGGTYAYGDSYVGKNGTIYTYGLPSYPIDTVDYKAIAQFGADTEIKDEEIVAAIGEEVWSFREMYAVGTAYNNDPGLAQSEAVLDPESMIIFMGSNPGSEKSMELAANPNIKMYWYSAINEDNYVCGSRVVDNDYYHSYGVRIEGTAGAVKMNTVLDEEGNILDKAVVRGGDRYGLTVTGPKEWFASKPDAGFGATCAWLAENRYYAESWASMTEEDKAAKAAEVRAYLAKAYLGTLKPDMFYDADVKALSDAGKDVTLANLKSAVLNSAMNRSGEGYAIRLASTGALIKVVPDAYLTNTLWAISDVASEDQVALYEAGENEVMAKWAARFYELYTKLEEGQSGTQIRRQAYYPEQDATLDR